MATVQKMTEMPKDPKQRVYGFIDGFNLYHAINRFDHGVDEADCLRYQKYKWLCLRTLLQQYMRPDTEELVGVHYFTSYPFWDEAKKLRHQTYVNALRARGVDYTLGEFKQRWITCKATCQRPFQKPEEKQTDVNITTTIIEFADRYDALILVTADSDQVPTIQLLHKLHPTKKVFILPPIGRNSKELVRAAGRNSRLVMSEEDLCNSMLPNPVEIVRNGKVTAQLWKPAEWSMPATELAAPGPHLLCPR